MSKRSISVELKAEVSQYKRDLDGAAKATEKLAAAQELAARNADVAGAKQREATAKVVAAEKALKQARESGKATNSQLASAERKVSEAKRADFQATQNLKAAEQSLAKAKEQSARAAQLQSTRIGKVGSVLDRTAESGRQVSGALAAAGGAITAVGLAAFKTGKDYNTLQQSSRAALSTLLGSAKAANVQMDKLDAFARTSPFSKSTFITAQQQMLAFGIEASKVVPYMEAINDAVAAAGGSSNDFGEIAFVLSQIQAAGKITATDLMQLGQRGVNAAELIASQMGMTGAQIKASITDGSLGATEALDALTAGMSEKFEGASDNVKNTMVGASDRIKAAWRDLSSELMEPLVGTEGGGALVHLSNQAADAMRSFQGLPEPVKASVVALGGLTALSSVGLAGFYMLGPKVRDQTAAFRAMRVEMPRTSKAIAIAGKAATVAGAAITAMMLAGRDGTGKSRQGTEEIRAGIKALAASVTESADVVDRNMMRIAASDEIFKDFDHHAIKDLIEAKVDPGNWDRIGSAIGNATASLGELFGADWRNDIQKDNAELEAYLSQMATMATDELPTVIAAFQSLNNEAGGTDESARKILEYSPELRDALIGVADGAGLATDDAGLLDIVLGRVAVASNDAAVASEDVADSSKAAALSMQEQADAINEAFDALMAYSDGVLGLRDAERGFQDAIAKANESLEKNGKSLDIATEKGRDNQDALDEIARAGLDLVSSAREQGASQDELSGKMQATRDAYIAAAMGMGMSKRAAKSLADQLGLIPANVTTRASVVGLSEAEWAVRSFVQRMEQQRINLQVSAGGSPASSSTAVRRASGGSVFGAGTETSDSIPALLSNNEHVWSAREVRGAGGHGAVERLRELARRGLFPAFASGGRVGWAEREVKRWSREVKAARKAKDSKRRSRAESKLSDARARLDDLRESRDSLGLDVRRGELDARDGYSLADRLLSASKDSNLSKKQRKSLAAEAAKAEPAIKRLQTQLEAAEKNSERIAGHVGEIDQTASGIAASFKSGFSFESGFTKTQKSDLFGNVFDGSTGFSAKGALTGNQGLLKKYTRFEKALSGLASKGVPSSMLQQIAGLADSDIDQAITVAEGLNSSGKTLSDIVKVRQQIDVMSGRIGATATRNFMTADGTFYKDASAVTAAQNAATAQRAGLKLSLDSWGSKITKILAKAYGLKGYASGGYTGDLPTSAVAGVTHGREFVMNASTTAKYRPVLEAMHAGTYRPQAVAASPVVNVQVDKRVFEGMAMTLMVDGKPMQAVIRSEMESLVSSAARGY